MEVGKIAPAPGNTAATRVATEAGPATPPPLASSKRGAGGSAAAATAPDEVTIHPLDVAGALQILITEVREALTQLAVDAASPVAGDAVRAELALLEIDVHADYSTLVGNSPQATAATAPVLLVQMLLKHLPDVAAVQPAVWLAAATRAEASLRLSMDRAVDTVTAWREVPALVLDVARDTRALVRAAVEDDPPSPLWLRPEWLGLAPRMERFWRRRRYARRNLQDPDLYPQLPELYGPPGERQS